MSENNKRTRHTASFLISRFLNSKESLQIKWLKGHHISILRYIYDVIEMTYSKTGQEICNKSTQQLSLYSRTSKTFVKRTIERLIEHKMLSIITRGERKKCSYGVGDLIKSGIQQTPDYISPLESGIPQTPALVSPRHQISEIWYPPDAHVIKSCKKDSKKERESALSVSFFQPDEANILLAKDLSVDLDENLTSFRERHKGDKTQYEFGRWLKQNKEYKDSKKNKQPIEAYSAVNKMQFYESPRKAELMKQDLTEEPVKIQKLPSYREQLKINQQQGSKPNGKDHGASTTGNKGG